MKKVHQYFCSHKAVTLTLMWVFFAIALTYMLLCLLAHPEWQYWLCLIPAIPCVYLRLAYAKAAYDPTRDRCSDQYVPRTRRSR